MVARWWLRRRSATILALCALLIVGVLLYVAGLAVQTHGKRALERCEAAVLYGGPESLAPEIKTTMDWWPPRLQCHVTPHDGRPPYIKVIGW
jgi:hypothetical protein